MKNNKIENYKAWLIVSLLCFVFGFAGVGISHQANSVFLMWTFIIITIISFGSCGISFILYTIEFNSLEKEKEEKVANILKERLKEDDYYVFLIEQTNKDMPIEKKQRFSELQRQYESSLKECIECEYVQETGTNNYNSEDIKNAMYRFSKVKSKIKSIKYKQEYEEQKQKEAAKESDRWQKIFDKENDIITKQHDNKIIAYIDKTNNKFGYFPEAELLINLPSTETILTCHRIIKQLIQLKIKYGEPMWVYDIINHDIDNMDHFSEYDYQLNEQSFYEKYGILNVNIVKKLSKIRQLYNSLVSEGIITKSDNDKALFYLLFADRNLENIDIEIARARKELGFSEASVDFSNLLEITQKYGYSNKLINLLTLIYIKQQCDNNSINERYSDIFLKIKNQVDSLKTKAKNKKFLDSLDLEDKDEDKVTIQDVDLMSGREFELFISELFEKMGYKTYVTKASNDQGIDVIAENNEIKIAIQAKCYSGIVGNHAIMEAVGGMKYYKADKCMVITNRKFTKQAIELARANDVELWDRKTLEQKIHEF